MRLPKNNIKTIFISFALDKKIGFCNAPAEPKPDEKTDITWQSQSRLGDQNWGLLKNEFIGWVGPWTYLSLGEFLTMFVIALVSLISSNFDIWFDSLLAHEYYVGTFFEFYFTNQSHPTISELNCTAKDIAVVGNVTFYTYNCFKTEKLLGVLTLIPIFLPGTLLSFFLARGLRENQMKIYSNICLALTPLICAIFPILVFITKVIMQIIYTV